VKEELPLSEATERAIHTSRQEVMDIVNGKDDRLLVVCGPCSIHDVKAGREYAIQLRNLAKELSNDLMVVMRVYFEKPRTTVGWKGLINDPELNGTYKINQGIKIARKFLLDVNELGLPCGVEFLDTISPQFIADLVSWGAIGARTTESQVHRELASGLSMPVGFKNSTGGEVQVGIDAVRAARCPHSFLGVTSHGISGIVRTKGNKSAHIILRGGRSGTNYDTKSIKAASALCEKANVKCGLVVDCSHGNSKKIHTNQPIVAADVAKQIENGETAISGVMIESNLKAGKQTLKPGVTHPSQLKYGVSVTDACIDIDTTATVLRNLARAVRTRRGKK
jgi:3-deoxy-7-phosphoheptulonate synthase